MDKGIDENKLCGTEMTKSRKELHGGNTQSAIANFLGARPKVNHPSLRHHSTRNTFGKSVSLCRNNNTKYKKSEHQIVDQNIKSSLKGNVILKNIVERLNGTTLHDAYLMSRKSLYHNYDEGRDSETTFVRNNGIRTLNGALRNEKVSHFRNFQQKEPKMHTIETSKKLSDEVFCKERNKVQINVSNYNYLNNIEGENSDSRDQISSKESVNIDTKFSSTDHTSITESKQTIPKKMFPNIICTKYDRNSFNCNSEKRSCKILNCLKELLTKEPDEILLTILNDKSGFLFLLEQEIDRDLMAHVLLALGKAVSAYMSNHNSAVINRITSSSKFLNSISKYLASFQVKSSEQFHLDSLSNLISFLNKFQMCLPSSASDVLLILLPLLRKTCQLYLFNSAAYTAVLEDLDDLETRNNSFLEKYSPSAVKHISRKEKMQLEKPPENYRTIPILPTIEDFCGSSAFIRPNVVNGCYQDTEHYLDVQFRLLREDFVKPLRDGIAEYLSLKKSGKSIKHCKDVRVYEDVHIISQQFVNAGLVHIADFKGDNFANINWECNKRFLTNSLLCLSNDDFKTVFLATVAERKPEELVKGKVVLRFEEMTYDVLNINPLTGFVVIETTSHFESYRHNLKALSELNERQLPMKRYIVEVDKTVLKPEYLNYDTFYDMRPLLIPLDKKYINTGEDTTYNYPFEINSQYEAVRILDENSWPSCKDLNLNSNQYAAIKAAITKEFAVIQGPPGTGKTFIGLRIVQLLLHNLDKWSTKTNSLPVLIVCQTNHALDQFLEGISMFTESIVRIGGGSKHDGLEKFKLQNLKKIVKDNKNIPHHIHSNIKQERDDLSILSSEIEENNRLLEKSRHSILNLHEIKSHLSDIHYYSLTKHTNPRIDVISDWLEICAEDFDDPSADEDLYESELWLDMNNKGFYDICFHTGREKNNKLPVNRQALMNGNDYKRVVTKYISIILKNCDTLNAIETQNLKNVWEIDVYNRWKLYKYWIKHFIENQKREQSYIEKKLNTKHISKSGRKELDKCLCLINKNLLLSLSSVFNEYVLKDCINPRHFQSLRNAPFRIAKNLSVMYNWLELKCKDQKEIKCRIEVVEKLEAIDLYIRNSTSDVEYEDDIAHIEAHRKLDADEFVDVSYNEPLKSQRHIGLRGKEWEIQGEKRTLKKHIKKNLNNNVEMSEIEANRIRNVWDLTLKKRWQLYKFWLQKLNESELWKKYDKLRMFREKYKAFCELRSLEDVHVCKGAQVIGMTTTGAAKYKHIIQPLNPVIVVVEEAAEILESHIITSLAPHTQHVILIGDHEQLKPNPTVYMLSVQYDLDVSLFERMVKNGLPNYQLLIQQRMRPDISELLVPHIYAQLENHESVNSYENIRGVTKNVFFISHNHNELQENDSKSKVNRHEAQFLIRLCKYFICQNYDPSQITILTTYTGQLFELKRFASGIVEGVRFAAVDNYQGEENDIILISFVRSNEDGEIGFLKISNRVCVALSRAKKGLYCIGNFHLLAEKSRIWKEITNILSKKGTIGSALELVCQNHPETINLVANAEDFDSVPEGGCGLKCDYRMSCGHECLLVCHPYDKEHENVICSKPCARTCREGHLCKKKCHEQCEPCTVPISKIFETCNHKITVECHLKDKTLCSKPCERLLQCGHKCSELCELGCTKKCEEMCSIKSSACGHEMSVMCFRTDDIGFITKNCKESCKVVLPCEHICEGTCGSCYQGKLHIPCTNKCKKKFDCGHECQSNCYETCNRCEIPVIKKLEPCGHEMIVDCYLKNNDVNCTEKCKKLLLCRHEVLAECYLKVEEVKCFQMCKKLLPCGHEVTTKCYLSVEKIKCIEKCKKTLLCGHEVLAECYLKGEDVKCNELSKKLLPCGHETTAKCYLKVEEVKCIEPCKKSLNCGHLCYNKCGDPCGIKCYEISLITSSICGHGIKAKCFRVNDGEYLTNKCTALCASKLSCGHMCKGTCATCHQGRFHIPCYQKCKRALICGHECKSTCSKCCPPCRRPCYNWCSHGKCSKKCSELCKKCTEPCTWICPHKRCTRLCWELCDRTPCDEPCSKILACQHPCVGFCGEPCPTQCRICNKIDATGIALEPNARYVILEDCSHIYEVKYIAQWINNSTFIDEGIKLKICPKCKTVIRRNYRFGNIIKACLEDVEKAKKFTSKENVEMRLRLLKKLKSSIALFRVVGRKSFTFKQCITEVLKSKKHRTLQELLVMSNCLSLINIYVKAITLIEKLSPRCFGLINVQHRNNFQDSIVKLKSYAAATDVWMSPFFHDDYLTASEQQLYEFSWEVHRLEIASKILQYFSRGVRNRFPFSSPIIDFFPTNSVIISSWDKLMNIIVNYRPFREQESVMFCSELKVYFATRSIDVNLIESEIKKEPVLALVNQSAGQFYKCSNGHVRRSQHLMASVKENTCEECKTCLFSHCEIVE